ncbi:MAG: hypothetical protein J4203_08070 [Candidatus Diapherotrites archaeon]|uniref:Uncharacterized protein n=1 Tax=Candidatus Iainarchaeum sp. TaxID=3101447 RepID=A0A8T4L945_9ARCH|nr:hypothetical protein [Candidatus Diapherotrites archaeon]
MQKNLLLLLAAISLFSLVYGVVSSGEAVKFVTEENRFLHDNEEAKQPNYRILHAKEHYWVIPVVVDEEPTTYFAVGTVEKKLVADKFVNRQLFKTADVLREFLLEKERASKNPQVKWIVTGSYARIFESLARMLSDEAFELNTIASTANDPKVSDEISSLKASLAVMSDLAENVSAQIDEAASFESDFTTQPDTAKTDEFKKKFDAVFGYLFQLEDKALEYRSRVSELKRQISVSDAEADAKSYMIKLAEPPQNFNEIGNMAIAGTGLKDVVDKIFVRVNSRLDNFLNEFGVRQEMSKAYLLLYGASPEAAKLGNYKDLRSAVNYVLTPENKAVWADQAGVLKLEENWRNAENAYKKGDYVKAQIYAGEAVKLIKGIQKKGVLVVQQPPLLSDQLLQQAIMALAGLLVLVFLLKNREKIGGFFRPEQNQSGERLELGWKNE